MHTAPQSPQAAARYPKDVLCCRFTKTDDGPRLDYFDLFIKKQATAVFAFGPSGRAVLGRAAFNDVRDVSLFASGKTERGGELVEDFAGRP